MPFETAYIVRLAVREFREYLVETDEKGSWGDAYFQKVFGEHIDDDTICIEYKYVDSKCSNKTIIKWRVEETEKVYQVSYTGSSRFAMWWCQQTDEIDGDMTDNDIDSE